MIFNDFTSGSGEKIETKEKKRSAVMIYDDKDQNRRHCVHCFRYIHDVICTNVLNQQQENYCGSSRSGLVVRIFIHVFIFLL